MQENTSFRKTVEGDLASLMRLYQRAFPEEDLSQLVRELIAFRDGVLHLSAFNEDKLVGHISFTPCQLSSSDTLVSLLGPLVVHPKWQKQGVGSGLVKEGLRSLAEEGCDHVLVFGDPQYYGRFGFKTENNIKPPYPIPEEWQSAWQSLALSKNIEKTPCTLKVPSPWQNAELWGD